MINPEFFTSTKESLLKTFFNGLDCKPAKNGVYFVAHTDTVHRRLPTLADIQEHRGILTAPECGLGADDRCGCYIATRLLEIFPDCGFILSHDEEIGDNVFKKTAPDLSAVQVLPKIFISFDRKGVNEYVDYGHRSNAIEVYLNDMGIKRENGTGSTCKHLSEKYKAPCVNICFGGGNFHDKTEYVDTYLMERLFEVYIGLVNFAVDNELDYTENTQDDLGGEYDDAVDYVGRGIAYTDIDDYDSAIAEYTEAIRLDPDYAFAYYLRGDAYRKKFDINSAIADYTEAIRLDPNDTETYACRGDAYSDKGDLDLAVIDYTDVIRLVQAEYCLKRGNAYYRKGDYDPAIADYDKVISLKPDSRDAYYNRGGAYLRKGDRERTAADFDRARKISSNPHYLGDLYDHNVNYDRAVANYSRAISLEPDDAEAYNNRGTVYAHKGDYKSAVADFDTAILLAPKDAVAYKNRGNAYSLMGETDLAIADFTEAVRLNPNFESAHKALAKLNAVPA